MNWSFPLNIGLAICAIAGAFVLIVTTLVVRSILLSGGKR